MHAVRSCTSFRVNDGPAREEMSMCSFAVACLVTSCISIMNQDPAPADLIVVAQRLWTGEPNDQAAIAIRDGAIVAKVAADQVGRYAGPKTQTLLLPTAIVLPGLVDAHGHITGLGGSFAELDVRGASSAADVAERVRAWIEREPGDGWILGRNWDQSLWPGMTFPTAEILDAIAADRPVWLRRVDGHAGWANSEAMRRAGVGPDTKSPAGGQIIRDKDGKATGVFVDAAMSLIAGRVPPPSDSEIERRIFAAQEACVRVGLTGVHDAGVGPTEERVFRALDKQAKLKLRVYAMASPGRDPVAFAHKPPQPRGDRDRFEMRAIKLYADGAMGSRGALLFEPYADDPSSKGLQLIDEDVLRRTTEAALRNGWQICTHAIGDKGNALVLDAYEQAIKSTGVTDARLRIEHAQVIRRADVARFRDLGIIASMQPSHVMTDQRWADIRLGADSERVQGAYAWRWFLDAGVPLAFGSDFPVEVPSPLRGLYASVSRQGDDRSTPSGWHPDQTLTLDESVRAFTAGSAYASFSETRTGTLKPGKRADLTIMDAAAFDALARGEPVDDTAIVATIIDGEIVYQRPSR